MQVCTCNQTIPLCKLHARLQCYFREPVYQQKWKQQKWFVVKDEWQQQSIFELLYFKVGHCVSKCVLDVFIMGFHSNIVVLWEPLVNWPILLQTER